MSFTHGQMVTRFCAQENDSFQRLAVRGLNLVNQWLIAMICRARNVSRKCLMLTWLFVAEAWVCPVFFLASANALDEAATSIRPKNTNVCGAFMIFWPFLRQNFQSGC